MATNKKHNRRYGNVCTFYGGKYNMLDDLLPAINGYPHVIYTETFLGGGAVFWNKIPSRIETINDKSDFVVNFYEVVQRKYEELKPLIDSTLVSRTQKNRADKIWRQGGTDIERAWAFWFLTNISHSGKWDGGLKYSNEQHSTTVKQIHRKKDEFSMHLVNRIENAVIENRDALWVLESRNVSNALHFIDPPYIGADQGHYKGYKKEEAVDLLDWLTTCKGAFMMTVYSFPELQEYAAKNSWLVEEKGYPIYASMRHKIRKTRKIEVIVKNFDHHQTMLKW